MATFYYENEYSKDDDDNDKKRKKSISNNIESAKKSTGRADDILSMIRARNNPNIDWDSRLVDGPKVESKKLKEILSKMQEEDPEIPDYSDTPIYKIGNEDGYEVGYNDGRKDGYNEANAHYKPILNAIQTLLRE